MTTPRPHRTARSVLSSCALFLLCTSLLIFCACRPGYQDRVLAMHQAIADGHTHTALKAANALLQTANASQSSGSTSPDAPLLLLERAVLLQTLDRHKEAVRDFQEADRNLEILNLQNDDSGNLGKYLFSDDSTIYKAPPHEKLLVNTLGLISYLALGDAESARVEARRLSVLQKYFEDSEPDEHALFSLGSYLAGIAFEVSGRPDEALRYYSEAYSSDPTRSLAQTIGALSKSTGTHNTTTNSALQKLGLSSPDSLQQPKDNEGLLFIVIQHGLVPYKESERRPAAFFAPLITNSTRISSSQRASSLAAIDNGALKWVNLPILIEDDSIYQSYAVRVNNELPPLPSYSLDVRQSTLHEWNKHRDDIAVAAFTRMVTRAVAGDISQGVAKSLSNNSGIGALVGIAVEGAMTANDTPDTRSWTSLPAYIQIYRLIVPAGQHTVTFEGKTPIPKNRRATTQAKSQTITRTANVQPGGFALVNARFMR